MLRSKKGSKKIPSLKPVIDSCYRSSTVLRNMGQRECGTVLALKDIIVGIKLAYIESQAN